MSSASPVFSSGGPQRALDLGCGSDKIPGAIGIDVNPSSAADIVQSLDQTPWPLEESSFDFVRAQDVLEHVDDFIRVVEEIYRVAKPGALVEVRMPFMSASNFATDPTHRRSATHRTFDYFDKTKELSKYQYSRARFTLLEFQYSRAYHGLPGSIYRVLDYAILPLVTRYALTYEAYFAYLYPMQDVRYLLRVEKEPADVRARIGA